MKYAIIEGDLIVNVIEADAKFIEDHSLNAVPYTSEAFIGGSYKDGIFTPPPPVVLVEEVTE